MPAKLEALLKSRKFWALIMALVTVGIGAYTGQMPVTEAIQAAIAALAAYMVGTGLDQGNPPAQQSETIGPNVRYEKIS